MRNIHQSRPERRQVNGGAVKVQRGRQERFCQYHLERVIAGRSRLQAGPEALPVLDLPEHDVDIGGWKPVSGRIDNGAQLGVSGPLVVDYRHAYRLANPF